MNKSIYLSVLAVLLAGFSSPVQAEGLSSTYSTAGGSYHTYDTGGALIDAGTGLVTTSADQRLPAGLNSKELVALYDEHPEKFPATGMSQAELVSYYKTDQKIGGKAVTKILPKGLSPTQLVTLNKDHPEKFPRANMTQAELTSFYKVNQALGVQRDVGTFPSGLTQGELSYLYKTHPESFPEAGMTQAEIADYYKLSQGRYSAAAAGLVYKKRALPRGLSATELTRYYKGNPSAFPSRSMTQAEIEAYYSSNQSEYYPAKASKSAAVAGGAAKTTATKTTASTTSKKVDSKAIAKYVGLVAGGAGGAVSGLLAAGTSVGGAKGAGTAGSVRKFTNLSTLGLTEDQIVKNNQNQLKALLALLSK